MSRSGKRETAAIEQVARHFGATWEDGGATSPDAYLTLDARRIAVDVAAIDPVVAEHAATAPRLRFDKVALRLISRLQAALSPRVPDGKVVILTVTAPIRLPAKTAAELERHVGECLRRGAMNVEISDTICANQTRVRFAKGIAGPASKVIVFVHNPDTDPRVLFDLTTGLLKRIGAAAEQRPPVAFSGDRWLVIADEQGSARIETYRHVYSQLRIASDFSKILVVLADGQVEALLG
ncbi:MAG: hypothetical protein JF591_07980 [Lysobacter sp.]|nr:hypothetical protein [Lysobacter sp.]